MEKTVMQRMAWSPREVAEITGISVGLVRKLIKQGSLSVVRIGKRILISDDDLQSILNKGLETNQ